MHRAVCPLFTGTLRKNLHVTGSMKLRKCFRNTKASFLLSGHNHKAVMINVYVKILTVHMPKSFHLMHIRPGMALIHKDQVFYIVCFKLCTDFCELDHTTATKR